MKFTGLFREVLETSLTPAPTKGESLFEAAYQLDKKTAAYVADYLEHGYLVAPMLFACKDLLGSGEYITGCYSLLSDGLWAWRRELCFYVRRHKVSPGDEFVTYALGQSIPPQLDTVSLKMKARDILRAYEAHENSLRNS